MAFRFNVSTLIPELLDLGDRPKELLIIEKYRGDHEYFTFKDESGAISRCFDCSIVSPTMIYGLKNIVDDSWDIWMMYDDSKNINDTSFTITEVGNFKFHYPYMGLIKGGKEIITYDFTKSLYGYCKLNCPIIAVTSTESIKTSISFHVLLDVGPFFVYAIIETKDLFDLTLTFAKRFIEK